MKNYFGNYLGFVIDNNDPEFRGRVQVFVPHLMPTLYENWNQKGENISIKCVGDNLPQGLTSDIVNRLRKILPWAEAASPIVGQSAPGGAYTSITAAIANAITAVGRATAGAISEVGHAAAQSIRYDQTPTSIPTGNVPPGTSCILPTEGGHVDTKNLKPNFVGRLNAFFQEANALGYNVVCSSGYRSTEKQAALYAKIGSPGCARPGYSAHEFGIAVDLKVTGNGVSITQISTKADDSNRDTPEFRGLLAKHGLHQPLHPENRPSGPEKWHIEPIETPKAGGPRGRDENVRVAGLMSGSDASNVAENTSGSQFPPATNPLTTKSPSNTDLIPPTSPTTNSIPSSPVENDFTLLTKSDAPSNNTNQLAKDRIARFEAELKDPQVLDRIEFLTKKEGGASGRLILETACNRAFFGNKTLKEVLYQKAYFKDAKKDPNADKTIPHSQYTLDQIQRVIYNGANETNLATDQAYNDSNLFAKKFIDSGATGDWFNLLDGQKVISEQKIIALSTKPGSGNEEFIYRKDGQGDARSSAGLRAKQYAIQYNIQPTSPSNFNSDTPLPDSIKQASVSGLTKEPLNTTSAPATVNTTDPHGPTIVKNTNDCAKGMFAFPGVGAMVWVFFREGNPLFPVYFAASYSSNEWKSAYNASGVNPTGTNNGNVGKQIANSMKLNPNSGGGFEFTHIKDTSDPSGASDQAVAMMYGDDGSNITFTKGYHQLYTRHDRRDQIDGHLYNIVGGTEEKWVEDDSSVNVRGNVFIKIGKIDKESLEVMKELADFSKQMNDVLLSNSNA